MTDIKSIDLENLTAEDLRTIDDLIHVEAIGLTLPSPDAGSILLPEWLHVRPYSADQIFVFSIIEAMRAKGWTVTLFAHAHSDGGPWLAQFWDMNSGSFPAPPDTFGHKSDSIALAVCLAALKALGKI